MKYYASEKGQGNNHAKWLLPDTPYLQNLREKPDHYQRAIEGLLEKYQVQPVGSGYIDLILESPGTTNLIQDLAALPIAVQRVTWWCHCTPESTLKWGCPHGMGGPIAKIGGWFSECVGYPDYVVDDHGIKFDDSSIAPVALINQCQQLITHYLNNVWPQESFYSPCLYPGLWLHVPDDWHRKYYWLRRPE